MRALGFTRLISMENFRSPNFSLVADILLWLVKRFDPDAEIHELYDSEQDRVLLVRTAAEFMALKANLLLNTKRLYQADGFSVKELLKIASLLYDALQANVSKAKNQDSNWTSLEMMDLTSQIEELRLSRELASLVTTKGATIYELLGKEVELREQRILGVNNVVELSKIELALKEAISYTKGSISNTKSLIENIAATESSLDAKIEKKQVELERNQKRLQTLKKVRPAFLEEFEKLEVELQTLYKEYISRSRCISYLEQVQEESTIAEQERLQRRQRETRKMMEELQLEDARKLMEDEDSPDPGPVEQKQPKTTHRLRTATASKVRLSTGRKRIFGGMTADDDSNSLDSDSDLLLDVNDEDNSDFLGSGDDLDGMPLQSKSDQSEDDF